MITHVRFVVGMDNSDAMTEFITPRRETCGDGRSLLPGKILYSTKNRNPLLVVRHLTHQDLDTNSNAPAPQGNKHRLIRPESNHKYHQEQRWSCSTCGIGLDRIWQMKEGANDDTMSG